MGCVRFSGFSFVVVSSFLLSFYFLAIFVRSESVFGLWESALRMLHTTKTFILYSKISEG